MHRRRSPLEMSEYTRIPGEEIELNEKLHDSSDESEVEDVPDKPTRSRSSSREPELHRALREDPRFNVPTPSPWKRFALILFTAWLFWMAFTLRLNLNEKKAASQVIHADRYAHTLSLEMVVHEQNRYSKEFKYRPAASPIITERLQDGRTRIRGAQATPRG